MPKIDTYLLKDPITIEDEILGLDKELESPTLGATITFTVGSIRDTMLSTPIVVAANVDGSLPRAVNVLYGTSATPPDPNLSPIGTLYIQYVP